MYVVLVMWTLLAKCVSNKREQRACTYGRYRQFSFRPLFQALDINNVLLVFTCVILECKVRLVVIKRNDRVLDASRLAC